MTEPLIKITGQISTNKERVTRSVYTGVCDGQAAIIKQFTHPWRGWLHWWQCDFNARIARRRGIPAPAILYSGRFPRTGAWCIVYEYLPNASEFRWLRETTDRDQFISGLKRLLGFFAMMHSRGIAQSDTTLGNFLETEGQIHIIDEDRLYIRPWPLGPGASLNNVASLLSQWRLNINHHESRSLYEYYTQQRGWQPTPAHFKTLTRARMRFDARRQDKYRYKKNRAIRVLGVTALVMVITAIAGFYWLHTN